MVVFMRQIWPSPGFSSRAIQNPKVVADTTLRGLRWAMPGCVCGQAVGRPRSASAAGGETHAAQFSRWGLGRRSIPAKQPVMKPTRRSVGAGDPSRLKYTRYSAPSAGRLGRRLTASLRAAHRCVSVEIHQVFLPHAPCQPGASPASALTRVSPQAASRARGTVADPRRWPGSRRGRPFRRAGERGVCPQIAPGPSTPRTPGGDRWRPGEATGRGRPRRPFEKRAPRRPGGSALPPPPRHHSPGHRAGLRAVHVPAWDQGPPGQPPGQASHDQGSRLVRLPAATGVPPDWFSTLKMDYFGDAFVRQRRGPLIESGVCQRACLLVRVFERAAKGFLAPMAKLSPYRLQHKAAPVARLAIDFKNHGFGKGDGDALHHKNLTLSMRMPPRSIESAGTCRSERPHLPPSHVPHSPADE